MADGDAMYFYQTGAYIRSAGDLQPTRLDLRETDLTDETDGSYTDTTAPMADCVAAWVGRAGELF
jgi:hypothetical protein